MSPPIVTTAGRRWLLIAGRSFSSGPGLGRRCSRYGVGFSTVSPLAGDAELVGRLGVWGGVADLPHERVRGVIDQPPAERVADLLVVKGRKHRAVFAVQRDRAGLAGRHGVHVDIPAGPGAPT